MIQTFGTFTKNRGENLFFMPAGAAWEKARKFGFGEKLTVGTALSRTL